MFARHMLGLLGRWSWKTPQPLGQTSRSPAFGAGQCVCGGAEFLSLMCVVGSPGSQPPSLVVSKNHIVNITKDTFVLSSQETPRRLGSLCQELKTKTMAFLLVFVVVVVVLVSHRDL